MRRSTVIILGTWLGGVVVYAALIYLFHLPPREPAKTAGFIASFVAAAAAFTFVTRRMKGSKPVENLTLEEMEKQGLLLREPCEATRAFQVTEFEDEGCQYFVELKNGSVLYLCGQYLYEYEPMEGRKKQARKFPCTEFSLLRDKRTGFIVDVVCGGTVLEPECEVPPFSVEDHESGRVPADGDVIRGHNFDQLKQQWMKAPQENTLQKFD